MTDTPNSPQISDIKSNEFDIAQLLQRFLGLLISISVIFSVIGFLFIYILITRQTSIVSFESNPLEYLVIGFIVMFLTLIKYFTTIVILLALCFLALMINTFRVYRSRQQKAPLTFDLILKIAWINVPDVILFFGMILFLFGFSVALNPSSLDDVLNSASTKKSTIALIFKEDFNPQVWHLVHEDNNPRRTKPLSLIFEYSDSVLVRDLQTGAIVKVSKDMLAGIADDGSFDASKLPTAMPTP